MNERRYETLQAFIEGEGLEGVFYNVYQNSVQGYEQQYAHHMPDLLSWVANDLQVIHRLEGNVLVIE